MMIIFISGTEPPTFNMATSKCVITSGRGSRPPGKNCLPGWIKIAPSYYGTSQAVQGPPRAAQIGPLTRNQCSHLGERPHTSATRLAMAARAVTSRQQVRNSARAAAAAAARAPRGRAVGTRRRCGNRREKRLAARGTSSLVWHGAGRA